MMSELIRMSLFCDLNDMVVGDINHAQTMERALTPVDSSMVTASEVCLSPANNRTPRQQQLIMHETRLSEPEMMSCSGCAQSTNPPFRLFIQSTAGAKVSIRTLSSAQPDSVFEDYYLQSIVPSRNETDESVEFEKRTGYKRQQGNVTQGTQGDIYKNREAERPPYTYGALAAAAIFLSGERTLHKSDIVERVSTMFEVFKSPQWKRCWKKGVLKNRQRGLFFRDDDEYGINYVWLDLNLFRKKFEKETSSYAEDLFTQLGVPEKLEELRIVVEEAKDKQRKLEEAQQSKTERKVSIKKMKMPPRPCFVDETSNDSLQMKSESTKPWLVAPLPNMNIQSNVPSVSPTSMVYFLQKSSFGSYATVPVMNNTFGYHS